MAQVESRASEMTLIDLAELFGPMPAWRIRGVPAPGTATEQDVIEIEARENRLCELVDGVLVEKCVGYEESCLAIELARLLANYVKAHDLGRVSGEGGMMRLFPGLVRIPDVAFAQWSKFPDRHRARKAVPDLVPDLAVEILSEGNTPQEMSRKLDDYFESGVRLVWFVDLRQRTLEVFTARESSTVLHAQETLTGGDVVPGFVLPLQELFADVEAPRPSRRKRSK
jgi:Uma2 family endonuclease